MYVLVCPNRSGRQCDGWSWSQSRKLHILFISCPRVSGRLQRYLISNSVFPSEANYITNVCEMLHDSIQATYMTHICGLHVRQCTMHVPGGEAIVHLCLSLILNGIGAKAAQVTSG